MPFLLRSFSRGFYAKSSEKLEAIPSKSENSGTKVEALIESRDPIHIAGSTDFSAELEAGPSASQISCTKAPALIGFHDSVHIAESKNFMNSLIIQVGGVNKVNHVLLESILQGWSEGEFDDDSLPGDNYPVWLTFKGEASSVYFKVPQVVNCNLRGMILCIVYSSTLHTITSVFPDSFLIQNYTKATIDVYKQDVAATNDEQWKSILSNLEPCHEVEVTVAFGRKFNVKKTIIYLLYECYILSSPNTSLEDFKPAVYTYSASKLLYAPKIPDLLDKAFEESRIVVFGFTKDFISETMSAFQKIKECKNIKRKMVLAVFFAENNIIGPPIMRPVRFEEAIQSLIPWYFIDADDVVKFSWEVSISAIRKVTTSADFPQQVEIGEGSRNFTSSLITIQAGRFNNVTDALLKSISQGWSDRGFGDYTLPDDNYPDWLNFKSEGLSVLFQVPQVTNRSLQGMILCIVYLSPQDNTASVYPVSILIKDYTKSNIELYKRDAATTLEDEKWHKIIDDLVPGNEVEVKVEFFARQLNLKETVIYLVYGEDVDKGKCIEY
ncbi:TMV resistance protein N-like [Senna tora]|uniref:TMV resistance protein N-like n=1 Tax=Senna tora TaxID=362788 RepID=A0A834XIV6_9FABA|nr:TMV resistance protein N-like [Senna tora]